MGNLSNDKKSLAIITNSFTGGGAENAMLLLHSTLTGDFGCHLIALNSDGSDFQDISGAHVLNREWGSGIFGTISAYLSFQRLLWQLSPRTLIVNCELPELFVAMSPLRNKRIICVEHTSRPWLNRRRLGLMVRTILKLRKSEWVTVSNNNSDVWRASFPATHIPNPVSMPKLGNPNRAPNALIAGRLISGKRPEWAISATAKSQITLNVFGDGPLLNRMKQLAIDKNCKVKFHGYVSDFWRLVSHSDILLMPSAFEGDGIVVVEAILAGVQILVADNPDLRRFELPEECYCSSEDQMTEKLIRFKEGNDGSFYPPTGLKERIRIEREIASVSSKWIEYINSRG
jgi:glycosyltransferase involved in cell wall biosynthesis